MNTLAELYKPSLGLLTDLYQLTMAYGYWKTDKKDLEAVFHLFFRQNPFRGGFTIAAGLATAIEYLENLHFDQAELEYLSTLRGNDEQAAFRPGVSRISQPHAIALRRGRRARRHRGVSQRAAGAGKRPAGPGPTAGIGPAEHHQLPDAHRHQGRARGNGRRGRSGHRIRAAPGTGHRRGAVGRPGGIHRRLRGHLERAGRTHFRHPGQGNHRA